MMKSSCKMGVVLLLLVSLLQNEIAAQSRPQQSLYLMNYNLLNPAATGVENFGQIQAGLRRQWTGVDGAPSTNWITGNFALKPHRNIETVADGEYTRPKGVDNGHGAGFTFYQENIGPYSIVNLNAAYAYHVKLSGVVKTDFANPLRYDINAKVSFKNVCWLGGSYRRRDAFGGQLGINITPAFVCAYMYDYSLLNQMGLYSRGSHEVTVGYRFLKQHQHVSPRLGW